MQLEAVLKCWHELILMKRRDQDKELYLLISLPADKVGKTLCRHHPCGKRSMSAGKQPFYVCIIPFRCRGLMRGWNTGETRRTRRERCGSWGMAPINVGGPALQEAGCLAPPCGGFHIHETPPKAKGQERVYVYVKQSTLAGLDSFIVLANT